MKNELTILGANLLRIVFFFFFVFCFYEKSNHIIGALLTVIIAIAKKKKNVKTNLCAVNESVKFASHLFTFWLLQDIASKFQGF